MITIEFSCCKYIIHIKNKVIKWLFFLLGKQYFFDKFMHPRSFPVRSWTEADIDINNTHMEVRRNLEASYISDFNPASGGTLPVACVNEKELSQEALRRLLFR